MLQWINDILSMANPTLCTLMATGFRNVRALAMLTLTPIEYEVLLHARLLTRQEGRAYAYQIERLLPYKRCTQTVRGDMVTLSALGYLQRINGSNSHSGYTANPSSTILTTTAEFDRLIDHLSSSAADHATIALHAQALALSSAVACSSAQSDAFVRVAVQHHQARMFLSRVIGHLSACRAICRRHSTIDPADVRAMWLIPPVADKTA